MKAARVLIDEASLENDASLRRVMIHGPLFGIPSVWVAAVAVGLLAGLPLGTAALFALVPAVVGDPTSAGSPFSSTCS
jgi:hypothetical protein